MQKLFVLIFLLLVFSCSTGKKYIESSNNSHSHNTEMTKQGVIIIKAMVDASRRLHDVSWPVLSKNTDFCGTNLINAFGIMVAEPEDLPENLRSSYYYLFDSQIKNKKKFPIIVSVANNSPAHKNGIQEGDLITMVNEVPVSKNIRVLLSKAAKKEILILKIARYSEEIDVKVESKQICGYAVQPLVSPLPSAYADGSKIYVSLAALDFIDDDSELGFIVGHELVHNILHFKGSKVGEEQFLPISIKDQPTIRQLKDVFVFNSEAKESEADLKGLELSSKAGYNPFGAANYFRRLSIYLPELIEDSFFRVHLGNVSRAINLDTKANILYEKYFKD